MKVCIAEKPSVAKEIASVIGAKNRKDGYWEGNGYQVTWTFGHFCTLLPPEDYKPHWKRWDLNTLPMLPERFETKVMENAGVQKQFNTIKGLFNNAELVINCGDAGQEGELIQRWVIKQAGYSGEVQRLWISSLTSEAIRSGFKDLKPAKDFDYLYYAGSSRAIGDWLLGMNATRLYTLKYGGNKQVLSIGRVQTPTLAMLVDRHHEIVNFKPQPYWELQTKYRDTTFSHTDGKFFKKEDGEKTLQLISERDLQVVKVEKKDGKEYAPKLFDLTGLQVYCNIKFGLTADETLKTVQKLYEMKVVTYPRVDTTFLPNDMYPKVTGILKGMTSYQKLAEPLLGKKIRKSSKVFNDKKVTDHHAIIPTGEEKPLNPNQQQVYDIVAKRFMAVFYPDCKVAKTTVEAEVEEIKFLAKGKEILDEGWRVVFKSNKTIESTSEKSQDEENLLPTFEKGEKGPHEPSFTEKSTKAPNYYTEASLLRAMETAGKQVDDDELRDLMKANGIGRPSTRANIIETLFKRKYAERRKKQVIPTELGIRLIGIIKNQLLKSAELTGQWEKQLKEIEEGEFNPKQFIVNMKKMVDDLVLDVRMEAYSNNLNITSTETDSSTNPIKANIKTPLSNVTCPKCNKGRILKGKSRYGCSAYKEGCDLSIPFKFLDKKLTDNQVKRLIEKKQTTKLKGFIVEGAKSQGIIKLTSSFQLSFENTNSKEETVATQEMPNCPKCSKGKLIKGKTAYGCDAWKTGCEFRFSFEDIKAQANGGKLTRDLVLKIISKPLPVQS
ncbi:MAG: DNA topoisomerase-3 [Glaciecola sp.]|jgi:DNA topoisomerase-3